MELLVLCEWQRIDRGRVHVHRRLGEADNDRRVTFLHGLSHGPSILSRVNSIAVSSRLAGFPDRTVQREHGLTLAVRVSSRKPPERRGVTGPSQAPQSTSPRAEGCGDWSAT